MKKVISLLLSVIMIVSVVAVGVVTTNAATTETFTDENGISWTVTECYPGWSIAPADKSQMVGTITIPATYDGKVIIAISDEAFNDRYAGAEGSCSQLLKVIFPESIMSVGYNAFEDCFNLKEVVMPSVNYIGRYAFSCCLSLESVNFGNNLRYIDERAFYDCESLDNVYFPDTLDWIGEAAFGMGAGFDSVRRGGGYFAVCHSLTNVHLGSNVTYLGDGAFKGCHNLQNINFPSSLKHIGSECFYTGSGSGSAGSVTYHVDKLTSVVLPDSIEFIGPYAFESKYNIAQKGSVPSIHGKTLSSYSTEEAADSNGVIWTINRSNDKCTIRRFNDESNPQLDEVVIPEYIDGCKVVGCSFGSFFGVTNVKKLIIPSWFIGPDFSTYQFCYGSSIEEVIFEGYLPYLQENAFNGCRQLRSLSWQGCGEIGKSAFNSCAFSTLDLSGVEVISQYAFANCTNLNSLTLSDSLKYIGTGAFENCSGLSGSDILIPSSLVYASANAFSNVGTINSLTIEATDFSKVNSMIFYNSHVDNVNIGSSVSNIDTPLLSGGVMRGNVKLDSDIQITNEYAFYGNDDMSITTPVTNRNVIMYARRNAIPLTIIDPITESGGSKDAIVTLTTERANLRVTVPTVLPVSIDSDNNVTVANNAQIINSSKGQVDVTNAVLSGSNTWTLAAFATDFTKVPVDTKQYGFQLLGYNVPVDGNAFNNQFDTIDGDSVLDLSYNANVAIQSEAINAAEIGKIIFTVAWHK